MQYLVRVVNNGFIIAPWEGRDGPVSSSDIHIAHTPADVAKYLADKHPETKPADTRQFYSEALAQSVRDVAERKRADG